jgi:hypothetical protein
MLQSPRLAPLRRMLPQALAHTAERHHIQVNLTLPSAENPIAIDRAGPLTTPPLKSKAIETPSTSFQVSVMRPLGLCRPSAPLLSMTTLLHH